MNLYDLLRVIKHQDYTILYQDVNFMNEIRELDMKDIKKYLDYAVVSMDENWNIIIKGQKI